MTAEERTDMAHAIMWRFNCIGCGTCLVTHNVNLAERLVAEDMATPLMMGFDGQEPTYRVVPGISRVSQAEKIAKTPGFSRDDIKRMVAQKGYGECGEDAR